MATSRHEPDHIIPQKHGGGDEAENLAWTCFQGNRYKGREVGAFDPDTGQLVRLLNPRTDEWEMHFALDEGFITPVSAIGKRLRTSRQRLKLNASARVRSTRC